MARGVGGRDPAPPCAVHLDLDGARHIFRVHGWHLEAERDRLFESGLSAALELFSEIDVRATLFVIAEDLGDPFKLRLLREAVEHGHEIASHSTTHRLLTRLRPDEQRSEIHDSRRRLADGLGVAVEGFRAPAFEVDLEILRQVAEAGYLWDSSLLPTRASAAGLAGIRALPQRLPAIPQLIELPLPEAPLLPLPFHPSYAFVLGLWYFRLGVHRFRRTGAPMVLLFHLTEFSEPLERARLVGLRSRVLTLSHLSQARKLARCRGLLDLVGREYKMAANSALWADLEV